MKKKGCLIVAGVGVMLLLAVACVVFFVFRLTQPMVDEGERFLATVGAGSTEAAYDMTSATLRSTQTKEEFAKAVSEFGLTGYQSASWSNRQINNDRGEIEGTATTSGGAVVPLKIEMIKENGTWKVLSIRGPATGARSGPIIGEETAAGTPAVPTAVEAVPDGASQPRRLQSVGAGFHSGISKLGQPKTGAEERIMAFPPLFHA